MKRRKENYGFNEFNSVKFISIFMMCISISVLLLSIGFSSFNKNLVMNNAKVMVRADKDVRVSGIRVKGLKLYTNGEVVYFNVTTGNACSESDYTETQSNIGVKEGCMKFYAFNDNGGDTVNLILDHNTTAKVAWNNTYTNDGGIKINAKGPKEVLDQLKTDTSSWKGTITPSNYTMDQTGQTSNAKYTIDYSSYKARLITANEIAQITGNTTWDEKAASKIYYFDSKTTSASTTCKSGNTTGCQYGWLYDRTKTDCTTYGCLNNSDQSTLGYWTASSRAGSSDSAWSVSFGAGVDDGDVDYSNFDGVRPVITVSKGKLGGGGSLSGAISNNEEYLDSSIYGDIILPNGGSEITYEVEITNLGNVKVAITDIINEDNRLTYALADYTLGEVICDSDNNCTNGIKKKFDITLKYANGITPTASSIPFNLKFNFEQIYKVTYNGITCDGCKTEALGNNPFIVEITMSNPKVTMNDRILTQDEYSYENGVLTINDVDGDIVIEEGVELYQNGQIVYFNVTTGNACSESDYTETQSNIGVKEGCMKFYAFNDDGKDTVNLILDHNTTALVAWNSSGSNASGPNELLVQLKTDTNAWNGTEVPSNYTMDQTGQESNAKYTIDYSGYKARIITANDITQITGNTSWDGYSYYFDTNTFVPSSTCYYNGDDYVGDITNCKYGWLYDRTNVDCTTYGCLNNSDVYTGGYWTVSSMGRTQYTAFAVRDHLGITDSSGGIFALTGATDVDHSGNHGVRPVIEVSRENLKVPTLCEAVTTSTTGNVPSGSYAHGDEYTCELGDGEKRTFFVLETNGDNVSLIMNANIDSNGKAITSANIPNDKGLVAWSKDNSNHASEDESKQATVPKEYLSSSTTSWTKLNQSQITLPTYAQITGAYTGSMPIWLYDYLKDTNNSVSEVQGYWTSSPVQGSFFAWFVTFRGSVGPNVVSNSNTSGVRPVITIPKAQLG